jgi:hypothetical protein
MSEVLKKEETKIAKLERKTTSFIELKNNQFLFLFLYEKKMRLFFFNKQK